MSTETACCPKSRVDASTLVAHEDYTPKGKTIVIDGMTTYVVGDSSKGKAIVMFHDIFAWNTGRHRLMADELAEKTNSYVVLPDLYRGDKLEFADLNTEKMMDFLRKWKPSLWSGDMDNVYKHLKDEGCASYGLIGFCWGCWSILSECERVGVANGLKCAVNCHPSWQVSGFHNSSPEELAKSVEIPMLVNVCSDDQEDFKGDAKIHNIFKEKKLDTTFTLFQDQNHGFVSQGDIKVEAVARDIAIVTNNAVDFYNKHL